MVRVEGEVRPARPRDGQPGAAHRRGRAAGRRARGARRGRPAAVLGGGREPGGLRGAPPDLPLPRHPPPPPPAGARAARPGRRRDAPGARRRGLPRGGDAGAHPLHPRGRARLPGAEPPAAGLLVRAAPEPAALQAAPDGRRPRGLLPDRPLLPRRGPARRPPARVHPARRRGLVRRAARAPGADRARPARVVRGRRGRPAAPVPAHDLRRGRSAATAPTAPTCASGWRSRTGPARPRPRGFGVFEGALAAGGVVRGLVVPGRGGGRQPQGRRRADGGGARARAPRASSGRRSRPDGTLRSPVGALPGRPGRRPGRRAGRPGRCSSPTPSRWPSAVLGTLRLRLAERARPGPRGRMGAALGRRLPAGGVERGRGPLGLHPPPLHRARARRTSTGSRATPARCSRRPTTSC